MKKRLAVLLAFFTAFSFASCRKDAPQDTGGNRAKQTALTDGTDTGEADATTGETETASVSGAPETSEAEQTTAASPEETTGETRIEYCGVSMVIPAGFTQDDHDEDGKAIHDGVLYRKGSFDSTFTEYVITMETSFSAGCSDEIWEVFMKALESATDTFKADFDDPETASVTTQRTEVDGHDALLALGEGPINGVSGKETVYIIRLANAICMAGAMSNAEEDYAQIDRVLATLRVNETAPAEDDGAEVDVEFHGVRMRLPAGYSPGDGMGGDAYEVFYTKDLITNVGFMKLTDEQVPAADWQDFADEYDMNALSGMDMFEVTASGKKNKVIDGNNAVQFEMTFTLASIDVYVIMLMLNTQNGVIFVSGTSASQTDITRIEAALDAITVVAETHVI